MSENIKKFLDPGYIVNKVRTSEAFVYAQNCPENQKLSHKDRTLKSIKMAADILKEAKPSGHLTMDGHAMNITGQLTTFSESIHTLNQLKNNGASHKEKIPTLEKVAEFNHAVKEMVNENSSLTFSQVFNFIMTMNQAINRQKGKGETEAFAGQVRATLVGLRHEIAFEQMLGYMPDVEYQETTIEDDLKGADIFVSLGGSPFTPFDIKASWNTAQIEKNKARIHGFDSGHIIWSHVDDEDFNGTFRISSEIAASKSIKLHDDIENVIQNHSMAIAQ